MFAPPFCPPADLIPAGGPGRTGGHSPRPAAKPDRNAADPGPAAAVTAWELSGVRAGRRASVGAVADRLRPATIALARRRLGGRGPRAADAEEVAAAALADLWRAAAAGRLSELADPADLWRWLCVVVRRRAADRLRARRPLTGGAVRWDGLPDPAGPAVDLAAAADLHRALFAGLPEELKRVAAMRIDGHTNAEIARAFGRPERWAERQLGRVRAAWRRALRADGVEGWG